MGKVYQATSKRIQKHNSQAPIEYTNALLLARARPEYQLNMQPYETGTNQTGAPA